MVLSFLIMFVLVWKLDIRMIRWVHEPNKVEIVLAEYNKILNVKDGIKTIGLALRFMDSEKLCTIYAHRPKTLDEFIDKETRENLQLLSVVGHELMHCFSKEFDH